MTIPASIHSVTIDPKLLASDQLRQLSATYLELADYLDKLTDKPDKQADYLNQILIQESTVTCRST